MAESGSGIQELMAAETRASQIVAEARTGENIDWYRGSQADARVMTTFAASVQPSLDIIDQVRKKPLYNPLLPSK
jgi:hypothetical protein